MRRPQVQYVTAESLRDWQNDYSNKKSKQVVKSFPTYRELKKNMACILAVAIYLDEDDTVSVYRERKGEWGEYYEKWAIVNNKPTIIKSGWA
tara:strand:- start:2014 stop:2289 length:276 start_codon:yes stop_codon:yes gene_type:complete